MECTNGAVDVAASCIGFVVFSEWIDRCGCCPLLAENASHGVVPSNVELFVDCFADGGLEE